MTTKIICDHNGKMRDQNVPIGAEIEVLCTLYSGLLGRYENRIVHVEQECLLDFQPVNTAVAPNIYSKIEDIGKHMIQMKDKVTFTSGTSQIGNTVSSGAIQIALSAYDDKFFGKVVAVNKPFRLVVFKSKNEKTTFFGFVNTDFMPSELNELIESKNHPTITYL